MSLFCLLLLRMHDHRRLLLHIGIDKEADAEKDERNTEQLSHVKDHILLEADLRLLDEFDKEAHAEASDEECTDEESPVELRKLVFVHQDLEDSEKEIAEGLVELGRMFRFSLAAELEDEAPWEVCDVTIDF